MEDRTNQLKWGVVLSYMQIALSIVIQLAYTPLLIRYLGQSEYGLYNVVSSTIQILAILNLGFNGSYIRFFTKYRKEGREEEIRQLNGLFLIIFTVLGFVALACGLGLTLRLDLVFAEGLTAAEYATAKWLMLLFSINLAISFPATVFICIISAHERFVALKALGMLKSVLAPLLTIPFLLFGYGSITVVAVTIAVSVVTDLLYVYYVFAKIKTSFAFRGIERGLFSELLVFTSFIAINIIVDQVNSNMGKILLGRFKGTEIAAVYSVGYVLYQFYMMFSTSISGVFAPKVHALVKETADDQKMQKRELTALFTQVGRMQFMILGLAALGLVFFGKQFILWWAGEPYADAYYVMLLLVLPATVPLIQNIGIDIQRALNKHYFRSIAYLFMALLNVAATVVLCQKYSAVGAAMGTAISLLVANGIIMNIYYHKRCNINILSFWKSIGRLSVGMIASVLFGILIVRFVDLGNIWLFLASVVVFVLIYAVSMWCLGMDRTEKDFCKRIVKRFKKNA